MGNSPRPATWVLERSSDYGKTYKPWQYFAEHSSECLSLFSTEANKNIESDDQVLCSTSFSKAIPLEGGEVRHKFLYLSY
jgi:laminin alpha 3/5